MKILTRYFLLSFLTLLMGSIISISFAQNNDFVVKVSKNKVVIGERFSITFSLNGSGSGFQPPSFNPFKVLSGPNHSSSMQYINGNMSSNTSISYQLMALKEGEFTLAAGSIKSGKTTLTTEPVIIIVEARPANAGNTNQNVQNQTQKTQRTKPQNLDEEIAENLFMRVVVDKTSVFQGEQLVASYNIYTRVNIIDNNVSTLPSFNGFWTQDIEMPQQANVTQEVINGVAFNVATLKKTILFPQRSGKLEIDPLGLDVVIRVRDNNRPRSIFDQVFGSYKDIKYYVESPVKKINVTPLPTKGQPEGFGGAVGKFDFNTKVSKNEVKENDAINLNVTLSGKGNIKLLENLEISFPADFELYDPKITDNISTTAAGVSGKRNFEYLMIPRHSGQFNIPALSFSYFDPDKETYVTINSEDIPILVLRSDGSSEPLTSYNTSAKESVEFLGKDIRYIKTGESELRERNKRFLNSTGFFLLCCAPISLLLIGTFLRRKFKNQNTDLTLTKSRKARKMASKRLVQAKTMMNNINDEQGFYEEIFKALFGYLSDKLKIPVSELNRDNITSQLEVGQIEAEVVSKLGNTLDLCEMARFSPVTDISRETVYEQCAEVISKIEENLKKS